MHDCQPHASSPVALGRHRKQLVLHRRTFPDILYDGQDYDRSPDGEVN
jgi:hypothetical protein